MCGTRTVAAAPVAQPVQQAPTQQDPVVAQAAQTEAKKQRAQSGAQSTILTSTRKATAAADDTVPLIGKTLLGA